MKRMWRKLKEERGVSLIEYVISSALLLVVLGAAYTFYESMVSSSNYVNSASQANDDARQAMDRMTRAIRQAQELSDGGGALYDAQPRRIGMYFDIDKDGTPEKVAFWVQGQTIYWSTQEPDAGTDPPTYLHTTAETHTLIKSLKGGWNGNVFNYYGVGDPPPAVQAGHPENAAAVQIELQTQGERKGAAPAASTHLDTWVRIRSVFNSLY